MYFLLDYENVHDTGLEGAEYLNESDTLTIFYSVQNKYIKQYRLNQILSSGCKWKMVRLARGGKNALDYYIATNVGEIFATDHNASVAIISKDKGFRAVRDYWKIRLPHENQLVQGGDIFIGMSNVYDKSSRSREVKMANRTLVLEEEYARYDEQCRIKEQLIKNFKGSDYENSIHEIVNIMGKGTTPRDKYLASLKTFGRKAGTDIYRRIKYISA